MASSKPQLIHNHIKSVKLHRFHMPLKMPPHLHHIPLQPQILLKPQLPQNPLERGNIRCDHNHREALPIEYVREWEVIVVGQDHGDATIVDRIPYPGRVHFVSLRVEAKFAP